MKYKLLQIIPNFGYGGAERLTVNLMRYLNKDKYEVKAISMFGPLETELESILKKENIPVYYLGKRKGFDPSMFFKIDKVIKTLRPHIVHTHRYVLRYTLPSLLIRKIPVKVHTVHNVAEKEVDNIGKIIHKIAFSRGVIPISISRMVSESLTSVYGIKNVHLILNGIPVKYYQNANIPREEWRAKEGFTLRDFLFVNIARLSPQKNQELLIKAFAEGPARNDEAKLIIVGDGNERERLKKIVKSLGIEKKVYFLGIRTDIPDILNASDVFVLSADWEGNPLSVMEAMAAGKAVIVTSVGGVPELIRNGKTGILVPPKDVIALSGAMQALMTNRDFCIKLGEEARKFAEAEFDIKVMVKKYEDLYEMLLTSSKRSMGNETY